MRPRLTARLTRRRTRSALLALLLALAVTGCRPSGQQYELKGQILAVDQARQELTIKHQDIPGFMPAMTMAFKAGDARLMADRTAGELVTATLVVTGTEAKLRSIARTGFAPIADTAPGTRVMELTDPGAPVRDAALTDETGRSRRLSDWRGRVLAVTFIYTRCPLPNFCPLMERSFKAVQTQIAEDAGLRGAVQLLSVSFDPEYDTPGVLGKHAAALGADPSVWRFLTGDREEIESFASQFGVSVIRNGQAPDEIVHNLRTAIVDGEGRLVTTLGGTEWSPADMVAELRRARAKH